MDKKTLKQEIAKILKKEISATGTGASVTPGIGAGVATKYAFGKRDNKGTPKDWKPAPSVPNRSSKMIDYKQLFEGNEIDQLLSIMNTKKAGTEYKKALMDLINLAKKKTGREIWSKKDALQALDYEEPIIREEEIETVQDPKTKEFTQEEFNILKQAYKENGLGGLKIGLTANGDIHVYVSSDSIFDKAWEVAKDAGLKAWEISFASKFGGAGLNYIDIAENVNSMMSKENDEEEIARLQKIADDTSKMPKERDEAREKMYALKKGLNENYNKFKNSTKTRTKPEQYHSAVKEVKKRVNEINRLFEYMDRLRSELNEGEEIKYKKYTEKAIQQIKESTKSLFFKSTKLK
jgi:hypothetical protein